MNNVLSFPPSTLVDKNVPKNAFYARSTGVTLRELLTREFEHIVWLYKLVPSTLNVEDGKNVHEIAVFYCKMKEDYYSIDPFCGMDKLLPRHTMFIIEYGDKTDILMNHKEMNVVNNEKKWTCGVTEFKKDFKPDTDHIKINGLDMDAVYSSLLSQISGLNIKTEEEFKEQEELLKLIERLEKQAASLQKRIRAEKQFNRQIELNGEARKVKKQISELKTKIKAL